MSELIVALDVPSQRDALALVDQLDDTVDFYKVGLELYIREGPPVVRALHGRGKRVFLDLKLLDIPNTVAKAVESAAALDVELLTLHTTGGRTMMEAAARAAGQHLKLLGVTVLTSTSDAELAETWDRPVEETQPEVVRLAQMARAAGVPGIVASAVEAKALRAALGPDALIVTPGIRLPTDDIGDQLRVATPGSAVADGATHLVVGRPIRAAADPVAAAETFRREIERAVEARESV